jgi:molecular chaperone GrpE
MTNQDDKNITEDNIEEASEAKDEQVVSPTTEDELAKMKDIAQRALADLQNFKRKADEERPNLVGIGQVGILMDLLPVLDNFKRAFNHIPTDLSENEWVKGVSQIEKQFISIINSVGLQEIPSIGQPADPNLHEVVTTAPGEKDQIVSEIEKGYTFKNKVLRASKVVVGQG